MMLKQVRRPILALAVAALTALSGSLLAGGRADKGPAGTGQGREQTPSPGLSGLTPGAANSVPALPTGPGAADPAFDRFVKLSLVRQAWAALDADLLTDLALQLGEGERVLLRTHRSGVTAEQLFALAARVATEKRDKAALDRLAKAAESRGDKPLATQVTAALKLAGAARAAETELAVSASDLTPQAAARFQHLRKAIEAARILRDRAALDSLQRELARDKELPGAQRAYLVKAATEARDALPERSDPSAEALKKLLGPSRVASIGNVTDNTPFDPNTWTGTWNDITNAGYTIAGEGKYRVSIHNNANKTIYICAGYQGEGDWWTTEGWWRLQPGQTDYIFDTKNRYVYFYAEDGNGTAWSGGTQLFVLNTKFKFIQYQGTWALPPNPRFVNFLQEDMGPTFSNYTMNFD